MINILKNRGYLKSQLVPFLVWIILGYFIVLIPIRILGLGYMPVDDALRHSAKVVSGKNWHEILILRKDIKLDSHPGWHVILKLVHRLLCLDTKQLVMFSVIFLYLLVFLIPLFFLKEPEAWVFSMLIITLADFRNIHRLFFGRPFIFTIFVLIIICLSWRKLKEKEFYKKSMIVLTILIALSTWIHCAWYLYPIIIIPFFLAKEFRVGYRLFICYIAGVVIGAIFTLHPILFFRQTTLHVIRAFGRFPLRRMLVSEFQPFNGAVFTIVAMALFLYWIRLNNIEKERLRKDPVFLVAVCGWGLGFVSVRFWLDWAVPSLMVWMCPILQGYFEKIDRFSYRRFIISFGIAALLYITITNDYNSRWTYDVATEYLSFENPKHKEWLPDKDGIIYSDDMGVFYRIFFKNPHASWRYILGFEPTMMPDDDLKILEHIKWNLGADETFKGWVNKMKSEDRLILTRPWNNRPRIKELEWKYVATDIWIGRLPRK